MHKITLNDITEENVLTSNTFKNSNEFSKYIETTAYTNDETLLETLLAYADQEDLEPEAIAKLMNANLKDKLQFESEEALLITRTTNRLELF
jgi:Phage late-transcription coactivator